MNSLFEDGPEAPESNAPRKGRLGFGRTAKMTGLDVGATMIKAVVLERRKEGVVLQQAALAPTPAGVATEGVLTDGISVARSLKSLWNDYSLRDQRIATAVSGDRVYCQTEPVGAAEREDLPSFVRGKIAAELSYSPDSADSGYQEVPGGVVWTAAPAESIDWIRETVRLSSRTPVIIQTQGCALANAYAFSYQPEPEELVLLLHTGARRTSVVLMRGDVPLYGRDVATSADWPSDARSAANRVVSALDLHWDRMEQRMRPGEVSRVLLSGGAAASPELTEAIRRRLGTPVEQLDAFQRISHSPGDGPGRVVAEHRTSLAVAAGLALQGLEEA